MDNKTVEISGSHGTFVIDLRVGNIISKNLLNDEYANITQFNIHEFTNFWTDEKPMDKFPFYGIDIIDIGYWYNDENGELKYEPPESEHRDFIYGIITEEEYFGNQVKQQEPDKPEKKLYKVCARSTSYHYIYVKADSLEEAVEFGKHTDGGLFSTPDEWSGDCAWDVPSDLTEQVDDNETDDYFEVGVDKHTL